MSERIVPADPETWPAVAAVMATPGDPEACWCQVFRHPREEWDARPVEQNRDDLAALVADGIRPGLVAYDGEEPLGWVSVAPLADLVRVTGSEFFQAARRDGEDLSGRWAITCFVVREQGRGRGLLARMLDAAVEHARERGAAAVEGYPLDPSRAEEVNADELFCGTVRHFLDRGFTASEPLGPSRTLVTLTF